MFEDMSLNGCVPDARADVARSRMVDAAERLVAERGLAGLNLRDVQRAAGQRNKSAATYHFGSRDGLLEAVLTSRMAAVGQRRGELLRRARERGDTSLRTMVDVLVRPIAEHTIARPDSCWARFLFQCSADPSVAGVVLRSVEGETYRLARRQLIEAMGSLPDPLPIRRVEHMLALAIMSLAALEARRDAGDAPRVPVEVWISDLVDMCTALVRESPSPLTRSLLDRQEVT
jgi:AcrR family transcriptional regulator